MIAALKSEFGCPGSASRAARRCRSASSQSETTEARLFSATVYEGHRLWEKEESVSAAAVVGVVVVIIVVVVVEFAVVVVVAIVFAVL